LPPLEDYRFHRYDQVKAQLSARAPLRPVLEQAARVLSSGHTLWLVGKLPRPQLETAEPPELPPAPRPNVPRGWWQDPYDRAWIRQTAHWVGTHAERLRVIPVQSPTEVSTYETLALTAATGWHGE
jgi:hypothetical protein